MAGSSATTRLACRSPIRRREAARTDFRRYARVTTRAPNPRSCGSRRWSTCGRCEPRRPPQPRHRPRPDARARVPRTTEPGRACGHLDTHGGPALTRSPPARRSPGAVPPPPAEPLLTTANLPYAANSVFNPGVGRVDGEIVMLTPRRGLPRHLASPGGPQHRRGHGLAVRRDAAARARAARPPGGDLGLRGPAPHVAARARRVGDRLHLIQPAGSARFPGHDHRLPDRPTPRARSCRPRTRTRLCSRAELVDAGR